MPSALSITADGDHRARIAGRIHVANAAAVLIRFDELPRAASVTVDVSALGDADGITLAVLLAWAARAAREGCRMHFVALPDKLRALAQLCEVEELLG